MFLILVRKVVSFQNYANGGGGEVEALNGVLVASHRFQIYFLATLVALHFTPVSESVSDSFGLA